MGEEVRCGTTEALGGAMGVRCGTVEVLCGTMEVRCGTVEVAYVEYEIII